MKKIDFFIKKINREFSLEDPELFHFEMELKLDSIQEEHQNVDDFRGFSQESSGANNF